jgi:hypothetical protein
MMDCFYFAYNFELRPCLVGLQATTGLLFAKSLTAAAASPFTPGGMAGVISLDIFMIQVGPHRYWGGAKRHPAHSESPFIEIIPLIDPNTIL